MNQKIGRNDPCWCGSGQKYKKCHLAKESARRPTLGEVDNQFKQNFDKKCCVVPESMKGDCKGNIIRAHTVSKSCNLRKIARDGHVYGFLPELRKLHANPNGIPPELIGIARASTFTGFCAHHDKNLFFPLEDSPFSGTKEQCFLLAYRALARELFLKRGAVAIPDLIKSNDAGHNLDKQQSMHFCANLLAKGYDKGKDDAEFHYQQLIDILKSHDLSSVRSHIIYFNNSPTVFCSGGVYPVCNFEGNRLFNLGDYSRRPPLMTHSVVSTPEGGAAVFCWLDGVGETDYCERLMESISKIPQKRLTTAIIIYFFEFCENIYMSPEWWDNLDQGRKDELIARQRVGLQPIDCLCNTQADFGDWGVLRQMRT